MAYEVNCQPSEHVTSTSQKRTNLRHGGPKAFTISRTAGGSSIAQMNPSIPNRRIKIDVMKLIEKKYDVTTSDNYHHLVVKFYGPSDTPYEGGVWLVRVLLPENYPFKSPSVGFDTQIFHPNVDQLSGTICLDVLNQKWTALYDLVIIFDTFLPQLLKNPNPDDPLNHCAALVMTKNPGRYKYVVARHVKEFANPEKLIKWDTKVVEEGTVKEKSVEADDGMSVSDLSDCGDG